MLIRSWICTYIWFLHYDNVLMTHAHVYTWTGDILDFFLRSYIMIFGYINTNNTKSTHSHFLVQMKLFDRDKTTPMFTELNLKSNQQRIKQNTWYCDRTIWKRNLCTHFIIWRWIWSIINNFILSFMNKNLNNKIHFVVQYCSMIWKCTVIICDETKSEKLICF